MSSKFAFALSVLVAASAVPALAAEPGQEAADFTLPTASGKKLSLSSLRGKVVVVDIWASWCEPCKHELPLLNTLQGLYVGKDVVVLAVNIDDERKNAESFLGRISERLKLRVAFDPSHTVPDRWEPPKMPTTYVVDRSGVVRYVNAGFDGEGDIARLRKQIDSLVQR